MRMNDWIEGVVGRLQSTAFHSRRSRLSRSLESLEDRVVLSVANAQNALALPQWFEHVASNQAPGATPPGGQSAGSASFVGPISQREFLVRLTPDATAHAGSVAGSQGLFANSSVSLTVVAGLGLPGQLLLTTPERDTVKVVTALQANPHVAHFEENYSVGASAQVFPNEQTQSSLFVKQYGLHNIGQDSGTIDADIDAPDAWSITTGSEQVVVSVIDSGVDFTHPDLYLNIWVNEAEIPAPLLAQLTDSNTDGLITFRDLNATANAGFVHDLNHNGYIDAGDLLDDPLWSDGIDTDNNGFEDDLVGWDFRDNDNRPFDEHRHGTHVAGILGATGNNAAPPTFDGGVIGVAWTTSIMPLRFLDQNNSGDVSDAIEAINYTTMMRSRETAPVNIRVSNNSWGSSGALSQNLLDAVDGNRAADILFVAAAGNGDVLGEGIDNDQQAFYPANLDLPNVISVAAYGPDGSLARFSNYGDQSVDIAAPGVGIISTEPGGAYSSRNGTSMATPFVAGTAALIASRRPAATGIEIRDAILAGADAPANLTGLVTGARRLNAWGALTAPTFAPVPQLTPVAAIELAGGTQLDLTVTYTDEEGVLLTTVDVADLEITRPGFSATRLQAASASTIGTGTSITATYHVNALGGAWDATDNGEYVITLRASQIADSNGIRVVQHELGRFYVAISDPSVFFVNTTLDTVDADLSDGLARDAQGRTSLRAAIMQANAVASTNTIVLPDGVYSLSRPGPSEDLAATGDFDISGSLQILGYGRETAVIDANRLDRLFDVGVGAVFTLTGATLKRGSANTSGGAIRNAGTLSLIDVNLEDNVAVTQGGGLDNPINAVATLTRSVVIDNQTTDSFSIGGGGISNQGTLTLDQSTLARNRSVGGLLRFERGGAGGLYNGTAGNVSMVNTTISGNIATNGDGGGIYNAGTMQCVHVTVTENRAPNGQGGGVFNDDGPAEPVFQQELAAMGPAGGEFHPTAPPTDLAIDSTGRIYVADRFNNRVQVFDANGMFLFAFGRSGFGDGEFNEPRQLTVASNGEIFVADGTRRIQRFTSTGQFVSAFTITTITPPLAADSNGLLYAIDNHSTGRKIVVFNAMGQIQNTITQIAGQNLSSSTSYLAIALDGTIATGDFSEVCIQPPSSAASRIAISQLRDLSFNSSNELLVATREQISGISSNGGAVRIYNTAGTLLRTQSNAPIAPTQFYQFEQPTAVIAGTNGRFYVAAYIYATPSSEIAISVYDASGYVSRFGRKNVNNFPRGVDVAADGTLFVANTRDNAIQVYNAAGALSATFGSIGSGNGQLNAPTDIAVSGDNVVVSDTGNQRLQVFTKTGAFVRTIGSGAGSGNGQFSGPQRLAVDSSGRIYVADTGNHRVQVFEFDGTFVRTIGASGTGLGQFNQPSSVAIASDGTLYIADTGNHRVQRLSTGNQFSLVANASLAFVSPVDVTVDSAGNVYVTDSGNDRVHVFGSSGSLAYVMGVSGAAQGSLSQPLDLAESEGFLYIAERGNDRVSKLNANVLKQGAFNIGHSIVAGNFSTTAPDVKGTFRSNGANVVGSADGASGFNADIKGTNLAPLAVRLQALSDGDLPVHVPDLTSPALDIGSKTDVVVVDQLGHTRPAAAASDAGAVERFFGELEGWVFIDANGNGSRDLGDQGSAGRRVFVDTNQNGTFDVDEPNALTRSDDPLTPSTDETGQFRITGLELGALRVRVDAATGLSITAPQRPRTGVAPVIETVAVPLSGSGLDSSRSIPAAIGGRVVVNGNSFISELLPDGSNRVIYASGTPLTGLVTGSPTLFNISNVVSDGTYVAFNALLSTTSKQATFLWNGSALSLIASEQTRLPDATDTFRGNNLFVRDIDDGVILLQGNGSVASERGFFVSNSAGRIGLVANTNTFIPGSSTQVFTDLYSLGDGDGARFAFSGTGGFVTSGIFVAQNGRGIEARTKKNDPLPSGTDTFASFSGPVEIDGSSVFFYAQSTAGVRGIYVVDGSGHVRTVVDTLTQVPGRPGVMFVGQAGAVSLDSPFGFAVNSGRVVFRGQASDGTYGLYVWNDGVITKLIDNSMSLDGRTISKLSFGHEALDGNQFLFLAELSPFRLGIYRAVFDVDNFFAATVGAGQALSGVEFGLHPESGSVGGTVFTDANANGLFDNGEVPIMAAEVFVDANGNRLRDSGETFTTTNASGQYLLNNLAGLTTVSVVIVPPNGLVATVPASSPGVRNVTVLPGQIVDRTDFALSTPGASGSSADGSATGAVFNDLNENGRRDPGEPGLSGVTVFVDENGDRALNGG